MKSTALIVTAVSAAALFVTDAVAQAPADKAENAKMCKLAGMPMKMQQGDLAKLADQLAASISAIRAEKDPVALQQELAAHAALIKELQAKAGHMEMQHMMMGNMPKN